MADKNNNGIADHLEAGGRGRPGGGTFGKKAPEGLGAMLNNIGLFLNDGVRNVGNFAGSAGRFFGGLPQDPAGKGAGDAMADAWDLYRAPGASLTGPSRRAGSRVWTPPEQPAPEADQFGSESFSEYLKQAAAILGGDGSVNYDPQRQTARANAADADARLGAMYRELQGTIADDGAAMSDTYDTAIQNSSNSTAAAQAQIQQAAEAARSQQSEVLGNLGIADAEASLIQQGQDLSTQAAGQVADSAARGQATGELLAENQGTAGEYNSSVNTAAGLEGVDQQAQNQAALQAILAQIDMQEQQENASLKGAYQQQQLGLADALRGYDYSSVQDTSAQQQAAMEAANELQIAQLENQNPAASMASFIQAMEDGGYIDWANADTAQKAALLSAFAKFQ